MPERSHRRGGAVVVAGAGGCDRQSAVGIFVQLVAERAERDAEDIGGVGPIAEAMLERFKDEIALYVGYRTSDQGAGHLFGGEGRVRYRRHGLGRVETVAVRRQDGVDA